MLLICIACCIATLTIIDEKKTYMFTSICTVEFVRDNDIGSGSRHILTLRTATDRMHTAQNVGLLVGGDVEDLAKCEYEINIDM